MELCSVCHAPICTGEIIQVGEWRTCPYLLQMALCPRCGGPKTPGYPACISCAPGTMRVELSHHPLRHPTYVDELWGASPRTTPPPQVFPEEHDRDCPCWTCEDDRRRALLLVFPSLEQYGLSPREGRTIP